MRLKFKQRIWAIPGIAALLFAIGIAINISFSQTTLSQIDRVGSVDYSVLDKISGFITEVRGITSDLQQAITEGEKDGLNSVVEREKRIRATITFIGSLPGHKDTAAQLSKSFDDYYSPAMSVAKKMLGVEQGDPQADIPKMQTALKSLNADLQRQFEAASKQMTLALQNSKDKVGIIMQLNILVAVLVIAGLVATSYFIIRAMWRQLGGEPEYAIDIARKVALGDFTSDIRTMHGDQTSLLATMHAMQQNLLAAIGRIQASGNEIAQISQKIVEGNLALAERTDLQAQELQSTASSIEELNSTVRQNADNAHHANEQAVSASDVAVKGGHVVGQVINTMQVIHASSKQISDIISVIDGIAFQTNILALNAAVEAARAGEQGRGFAVVAAEVRALAQRSASAAQEIKNLIEESVDKVDTGSKLVTEAGATMEEIVESIKRVTEFMGDIAAASSQQSAGIDQVTSAISTIDASTQKNADLVEEAAGYARALNQQSDALARLVGGFKTKSAPAHGAKLLTMQ